MIELVVEMDDMVMEVYLEGNEFDEDILCGLICKGCLLMLFFLVIVGLVFKNKGVQFLLNLVIDFLFLLLDVFVYMGFVLGDEIEECNIECIVDDVQFFLGLVFKIMNDFFVGLLIFMWIYFGVLKKGDQMLNVIKGKCECVGWMMMMYLINCEEIEEVFVGDIIVFVGLKDIIMGDMVCDLNKLVVLEIMIFFELVIEIVVEFKLKVDQEKMGFVFQCLFVEDLFFCVEIDLELGQIIMKGMGEFYFDIFVDCMKCEFKVEVNIGVLQVVYCEIILQLVEIDYMYKKQIGGIGQFVCVKLQIILIELGEGYLFELKIVGGVVLKEYIFGVEKGIKFVMDLGLLVGFLVIDFKVVLIDGVFYDVDFLVLVFEIVVCVGMCEGLCKVGVKLLELIMKVEVVMLEEYIGLIIGDLISCCGMVCGQDSCGNVNVIDVFVLLVNMFGYINNLCLMLLGCVVFIMLFDYYEVVLQNILDEIQKKYV